MYFIVELCDFFESLKINFKMFCIFEVVSHEIIIQMNCF